MHIDDLIDLSICGDCLMLAANGVTPDSMDEVETAEYVARVEANTQGMHVAPGGDDLGFRWHSPCNMCGTHLGGDRFTATGFMS